MSFRLESERKGYIDLSDPKSWKMEGAHQAIFKHGERISEEHGAALAAWACGQKVAPRPVAPTQAPGDDFPGDPSVDPVQRLVDAARSAATDGLAAYQQFFGGLSREDKAVLVDEGHHETNKAMAARVGTTETPDGQQCPLRQRDQRQRSARRDHKTPAPHGL